MAVFWAQGLEGTSLQALEQRTGLNRSSLYSTFGGKVQLFCRALDAYSAGPCQLLLRPFVEQRGAAALLGYLEGLRAFVRSAQVRRGCMMVNTRLENVTSRPVRRRVNAHFRELRGCFRRAYSIGLEDGTLDPDLDPEAATEWLTTVVRGVLTGAAAGEPTIALERALDVTIRYMTQERK